jgi:hypothetical protein
MIDQPTEHLIISIFKKKIPDSLCLVGKKILLGIVVKFWST